jgi:hypothetical protein
MSIAQAIIGKKAPTKTSESRPAAPRPLTPEEIIDAVAESEFPIGEDVTHDTTGVGSPGDGSQPSSAMKDGKSGGAESGDGKIVTKKSKKTTGQVADTPKEGDPVNYGKGK